MKTAINFVLARRWDILGIVGVAALTAAQALGADASTIERTANVVGYLLVALHVKNK